MGQRRSCFAIHEEGAEWFLIYVSAGIFNSIYMLHIFQRPSLFRYSCGFYLPMREIVGPFAMFDTHPYLLSDDHLAIKCPFLYVLELKKKPKLTYPMSFILIPSPTHPDNTVLDLELESTFAACHPIHINFALILLGKRISSTKKG